MLNFLLAQNTSVPGAPKILPDCAAAGCTTLSSVSELFGNIAIIVLGLTGTIMLAVFVYGGILYLTSRGNPASIQKATKALSGAVIGLAIIFGAYTVVTYGSLALQGSDPFLNTDGGKYVICAGTTSSGEEEGGSGTLGEECAPGKVCIAVNSGGELCVEEGGDQHTEFLRSQAEAASSITPESQPTPPGESVPTIEDALETATE
jgi:hypothetical protein